MAAKEVQKGAAPLWLSVNLKALMSFVHHPTTKAAFNRPWITSSSNSANINPLHTVQATHIIQLLTVQVGILCLYGSIQHKVRGQHIIGSQQQLVEDIEVAFLQLPLTDSVPL